MDARALTGIAVGAAGLATPLVIVWLRRCALKVRETPARATTAAERAAVRRHGRLSVAFFVMFWVVCAALALELFRRPSAGAENAAGACMLLLVVALVAFQLSVRCPVCGYRLGYQKSLGVPRQCERCGARLRE